MTHQQRKRIGQNAVVIGSGMAGLLTARVLAEHFTHVAVIERDPLPASCELRKGVPQGRHAHALLARGQQVLEVLFPGVTQHLIEQGAVRGHGRFFAGGGYHRRVRIGPGGLFVSRPRLESEVRTRLLTLPNVHITDNCAVQGLATDSDRIRVTNVRVSRRESAATEELVPADLVVDATGRGSQAPAWLEGLGYAKPDVELVEVGMGYSTRLYRRDPRHLDGDAMVNVAPASGSTRACGMLAQEGDRWIVTLAGYFGDYPPTDEPGFLDFVRSLPVPDVYEVIRTATPLTEATSYRFPANQRRRYETLARFPDGFLAVGDAICSFTPIYGQGMTVAALEALALRECLAGGTQQLAQRFFRRASGVVNTAWSITVGNDARLAGTPSTRLPMARLRTWYMDRLHVAARQDARVASAFLRVANLMDAPSALLRPRIALHVVWGNVRLPVHLGAGASSCGHAPKSLSDLACVPISGRHLRL